MMQGCVSVGHDTNRACSQGSCVSSFLFYYPMIPCKYDGKEQNIYEGGWEAAGYAFQKTECPTEGHSAFSNTYHTLEERI